MTRSGIVSRETLVNALVDTIERLAIEGRIAPGFVADLLPLLQVPHWDAYAKIAGTPSPDAALIASTIQAFNQRVGYQPAIKSHS